MSVGQPVLDHKTSRSGRWLRERRLRIAFGIAIVEGILVALHAFSWWIAIAVAAAAIAYYVSAGRSLRSDTGRQLSWILAGSQVLVVLVPILVAVVGALALVVVGVLAVIALVLLFTDRR